MLDDLACEAWTEHYDCEKKSVSCLFQARQRYLDANRTGARTDEDLQSQWRAVKRIECLLDAMEQSEDMNHALEECRSKSHDASPIALSYPFYQDWAPQMPDVSECKQPRFPPPGSATYPKQVYDLAQGESFAECTAECCSRCQFFTCNSTTVLKPNAKLLHGFSQAQCCEAMPQVHWRAEEWPNVNCPTECGLQTMTQTRRVVCWDVANQVEAEESLCTSTKPSSFRVSCPATPSCRSCQATKCPNGFTAKADAPEICTGATCLPEECCNRVCSVGDCPAGWVLKANATCGSATCTRGDCCSVTQWSFNEWTDVMCDSSCGQPEQIETRLVRCRVEGMVQGDVSFVRDDACVAPKPVTSRVRCPATAPCAVTTTSKPPAPTATPHWAYPEWPPHDIDCAARGCGMRELAETRGVQCEGAEAAPLPQSRCTGLKPLERRVICPATPPCETSAAAPATTLAPTTTLAPMTTSATLPATEAAKVGSWVAPAWSTPDCARRCCGLGELTEERSVLCMDCNGRLLPECSCSGPKPATSTVLCARTSPCGAATVPAVAPTVVPTTAAPVTTQAGPSPVWAYVEWTVDSTNCSARSCGLGAVVQERAVLCNDLVTGQQLADSSCLGLKPPTKRTICPATAPCVKVEITDAWTCCPRGYALKKPEDLPTTCQQGSCEVESCCSMVSWVNLDWDETQACSQSCGLPQQMQERSVTCQAMYSGEVVSKELCPSEAPAAQRVLCPATDPCETCDGFACGDDALPVLPPPSCEGGTCESGRCCRKFLSGFHAIQLPVTPNTVANEGFLGGQLKFLGVPPQLADEGHSFRLSGHSVMDFGELALEQSSGFTAMVYLKPHVADGVDEDQAILVTKGVAGSLWQLSLTSLKQFKIESFKAVPDEALPPSCTCPSVHEDEWAHVIVRDNGTAMELLVNGKSCCEARPSAMLKGSTWLGGLQADLHAVELWNSVLTDPELDQLLQRYRKARPMWHPPQQQLCPGDSIEVLEDIGSLAFCKLRCEKNPSCRSVLFKSLEKSCSLRPRVTSKDRCRLSIGSLVANLDRGQCASGAFEWQLALTDRHGPVTEFALLDNDQRIMPAEQMIDAQTLAPLGAECALSDGEPDGPGCWSPKGFWEYRFSSCVAPGYLSVALKDQAEVPASSLRVRYATAAGEWKNCTFSSTQISGRFHLSCFIEEPLASAWWED
ncbi:unnamed protein product [Durusdinium trenchii]